jgi:hypothetical protein
VKESAMFGVTRRSVALFVGAAYLGIGVIGLATSTSLLGSLGASPMLNALHVVIGLVALWASQARTEQRPLTLGMTALLTLLVGGAFVAPLGTLLGLTAAGTALHAVTLALVAYTQLDRTQPAAI